MVDSEASDDSRLNVTFSVHMFVEFRQRKLLAFFFFLQRERDALPVSAGPTEKNPGQLITLKIDSLYEYISVSRNDFAYDM